MKKTQPSRNGLPSGTVVDCYSILKLIGSGGFSLIYLAEDIDTQDQVVVKEYLPKNYALRDEKSHVTVDNEENSDRFNRGRKLFFQEAKALARLRHPNIVNVRTFFLANNTSYLVMDYEHGKNLGSYIKKHKGSLSTNFLLTVFPPMLSALNMVHKGGHLHLDIKPNNIHVRPGGNPLLLDFGAVHEIARSRNNQQSQVVTTGYSPLEQYHASGYIGPWSDVYAMGATMRTAIEGHAPPSSIERDAKDKMRPARIVFKRRYPAYILELIDWAMEMDPLLRPQNAGVMLEALQNEGAVHQMEKSI